MISGNLGYQVEHHLYPDMPSTRYAEIAPQVKDICERYELPYNTGPFLKQLGARAAHDPAPRLPGRPPAAQARPLPRRRDTAEPAVRTATGAAPTARPARNGSGPEQPTDGVRVSMPDED